MSTDAFELLHPRVRRLVAGLGWETLRPVQELTIRAYSQSPADIVVCSPTASGKTEAVALPAFSDLLTNAVQGFGILWISPLRALINDGYIRLHPWGNKLGITVRRWHGDVSASEKTKARRAPDGLLFITPESLEANLILHRDQVRTMFAQVKVVVVDEQHSLLDTERGQHVSSLLARLFTLIDRRPRLIALSATLGDFVSAKRFLNPDSPDSVQVINWQKDDREIKVALIGRLLPTVSVREQGKLMALTPAQARELAEFLIPDAFKGNLLDGVQLPEFDKQNVPDGYGHILDDLMHVARKASNLVFFNRRALLEWFADRLHQIVKQKGSAEDPFSHHHSSLSREVRERTETLLKRGHFVTALATSSLELGIDMKSVRRVLQILAPFTVSSLKQRMGRSGREQKQARRLRLYTLDDSPNEGSEITDLLLPEHLRGVAVVELMLRGQLEPSLPPRFHGSVLVHQVMALLLQEGPLPAGELYQRLCVRGPFRKFEEAMFTDVLEVMLRQALLTRTSEGEMKLGLTGERVAGSHEFFAVFSSEVEFEVLHDGRPIGKLPITWFQREGSEIILDGRRWIIERINRRARRITVVISDRAAQTVFLGRGGDIHDIIRREMREVLRRSEHPPYLDPETHDLFEAARLVASKAGILERHVLVSAQGIRWFPWLGTKAMLTLWLAAQSEGLKCSPDVLALYYPSLTVEQFITHLKRIVAGELEAQKLATLLPEKKFERYDGFLSEELLITFAASDRLNLLSAQEAAAAALAELQKTAQNKSAV